MPKKIFTFLILILISFGLLFFNFFKNEKVVASSEDNVWGWGWGGFPELEGGILKAGNGWISFNCYNDYDNDGSRESRCTDNGYPSDYGVHICTSDTDPLCTTVAIPKQGKLIGYAWAGGGEDASGNPTGAVGWIKFDPAGPFPDPPNYSACLDLSGPGQACDGVGDYKVSGWARVCAGAANPDTTCDGSSNPAAGGWDGWIKLTGAGYETWIDTSPIPPNPDEFRDWAWGGDDIDEEAVIGWISFNCADRGVCGTSPYKVMVDLSLTSSNDPPSAINLNATSENYCFKARPPVELSWQYSDPNNVPPGADDQSVYQVQVATSSVFTTIFVDSGNVTTSYNRYMPPNLEFGSTYYWRVRVWDSNGTVSDCGVDPQGWCYPIPSSFTTEPRPPWPDFNWSPGSPSLGESIQFCSELEVGVCETPPPTGWASCYSFPCDWYWEFQYGNPATSSAHNVTTTFTNVLPGGNEVILKITDNNGFFCTKSSTTTVSLPLPEYREVAPTSWLDSFLAKLSNIFTRL